MLEASNLSNLPVPDPSTVDPAILVEILNLVNRRMENISELGINDALMVERLIDNIVSDLYGLTSKEKRDIGLYGKR